MNKPRIFYILNLLFFTASLLILYINYKNGNYFKSEFKYKQKQETNRSVEELKQIFKKYATDKFFHKYYNFYGKFLAPFRNDELEVLEIGLGCGMVYGPGKSLLSWIDYLPNAKISILEYDRKCAMQFKNKTKNLFIGSQSDPTTLKQVSIGSPYDMIIDDGGHTRAQQTKSLIGLFPYLKKGGIYIIEDLYYSFTQEANDSNRSAFDIISRILMMYNNPNFYYDPIPNFKLHKIGKFNFQLEPDLNYLFENVEYIVCFWHACALFK